MNHCASAPSPFSRPAGPVSRLIFFMLMLLTLCAYSLPGLAAPPQRLLLDPPKADVRGEDLWLGLSVTVDNEDGLRDMLKDGAVLELGVSISLERERSWWSNAEMAHQEYASILRHDPLSRDFLVVLPMPDGEREIRDRNLTRLLHASWRKLFLPVAPLQLLQEEGADEEFAIDITISLQHTEVPPWLEKSTVFWSSDVVPKESRRLPLRAPLSPEP